MTEVKEQICELIQKSIQNKNCDKSSQFTIWYFWFKMSKKEKSSEKPELLVVNWFTEFVILKSYIINWIIF